MASNRSVLSSTQYPAAERAMGERHDVGSQGWLAQHECVHALAHTDGYALVSCLYK